MGVGKRHQINLELQRRNNPAFLVDWPGKNVLKRMARVAHRRIDQQLITDFRRSRRVERERQSPSIRTQHCCNRLGSSYPIGRPKMIGRRGLRSARQVRIHPFGEDNDYIGPVDFGSR